MSTEPSKFRTGGFIQQLPFNLTRRTCLTRNGVSILVTDHRASYQERRALAGYDAVVSEAERQRGTRALMFHATHRLVNGLYRVARP